MAWDFEPNNMSNNFTRSGRIGGGSQGIYAESSVARYPIGYALEFDDGRKFRYGYFSAAVNRSCLVATDISTTGVVETDNIATAAAVGDTTVILTDAGTLGSAALNQYGGAYLHITTDTGASGAGYIYRIKSSSAASANAVTFILYDPLIAALTTASDIAITGNLYDELKIYEPAVDVLVAGVTMINVTAAYYAWIQTRGVANILADVSAGTVTIGAPSQYSDGVNGAVQPFDGVGDLEDTCGPFLFVPDTTGYVGVQLRIGD